MKFRMVLSVLLVGLVVLAFLNVDLAAEKMKVVKILDGEATIKMPASFTRMSNGLLAEKYTQPEGRPQEAWYVEKENGKVIIAFSATPNTVSETHIPQVLQVIKEQVEAYSPSSSLVTVNGHNMGKLELKTPGLAGGDGYIHNQMQLSSFKGKLLISSFNVTSDLEDKYKDLGESMLSSLKY